MNATRAVLKSPASVAVWLQAVAALDGEPVQHLAYPDDCAELVRQFAQAGVVATPVEAQAFWYAYCESMSAGWMTPFADCVGVLDDLAAEIEAGACLDDSLAKLRGQVVAS